MASRVAVWSADPLLGEVVRHVLERHGYVIAGDDAAEVEVHAGEDRIEVRRDGASVTLSRPFWEDTLVDAVEGRGPQARRPWPCTLLAMVGRARPSVP